jgi:hypothetical protein
MKNTADVTGQVVSRWLLQSISCVSAINPLVAFYDIHAGKKEILFFFVTDTTRIFFVTDTTPPLLQSNNNNYDSI